MARGDWLHNGRVSYKRTTIIAFSINVVVALYVLHSLYTSIYTYSVSDSQTPFKYTPSQIKKMEEANEVRKASEPMELIKLLKVKQLKERLMSEERVFELPQKLKWNLSDEILERLRSLDAAANATEQREAVNSWRKIKLKEAKKVVRGKLINSTISPEDAGVVARALSSDWNQFLESVGLWIPVDIIHKEHDDKPEGEEEEEVLPGKKLPPECHAELHTDYGGAAIRWGLTHPRESAYECCMACLDQARRAKPGEMKCNIWVYCPDEAGCHSPDIYEHKIQECWLKFSEKPKLNFKDTYPEWYRNAHPYAPLIVPWAAGVVSVINTNK